MIVEMKRFIKYLGLVLGNTFWGADNISKTLGVIGLFFVVGFQFTNLPWQARVSLFILLVFVGSYKTWRDQSDIADAYQSELAKIKDETPVFEVKAGEIKRYTAQPVINRYKAELEVAQQEVRDQQARANAPGAGLLSAFGGLSLNLPGMMRTETSEEKLERLQRYVRRLEVYETRISKIYKVELDIRGTRYDENIEVWLSSDDVEEMVLHDDYPAEKLPGMPVSDPYGRLLSSNQVAGAYHPSKLYLSGSAGKDGAYSKISGLNAQRYLRLFEDDFYIRSDVKEVRLHVKVSSQRTTPQEFDVLVVLDNAPVEELS